MVEINLLPHVVSTSSYAALKRICLGVILLVLSLVTYQFHAVPIKKNISKPIFVHVIPKSSDLEFSDEANLHLLPIFSLRDCQLVGFLQKNKTTFALIQWGTGETRMAKLNDSLGAEHGKLIFINEKEIHILLSEHILIRKLVHA